MADIPIDFTTNAATAAKDVATLKRETLGAADAAAKFKQRSVELAQAVDKQVAAVKRAVQADKEMQADVGRLTSRGGQLGRRFGDFRSNNPTAGGGGGGGFGGGGGHGRFGVGGLRGIGHLASMAGIPGAGEIGGIGSALAHLGPAAGYVALAAAALAPAAILFQRAGVKAEQAAETLKAAAAGHKLADDAFRAGNAAKIGNAKGAFGANGDGLIQLLARGGSADEARMLTKLGIGDAVGGLSAAQLIDPSQRGDAIAAARRAAATGEGSFSDFIGLVKDHQVSISGNGVADVGALIGAKRGTAALSAGEVGALEGHLASGQGLGLTQARASRGRAQDAQLGAALDTDSAINGFVDDRESVEDPFAAPREAAMSSLKEAIDAMQEAADQQGAVAARFANFMAKFGLSGGSASVRAKRNAATMTAAAGVP